MADQDTVDRASALMRLHRDPELLTLVNVWDAASAKVVASVPGTRALATASHSIAASYGYPDGEQIPVGLMLEAVGRIVAATELPVTADLEAGYGDPGETVRRAIGLGVVGCNLEDQMKPVAEAVTAVEAVLAAAAAEGVEFVLNARTDAFLRAGDRDAREVLADAVDRGRAYLDAGAPVVFVPGILDERQVGTLVEAFGPQRLSLIALPGALPPHRMAELGVARVSFGPMSQRVALTALAELTESALQGGGVPEGTRALN
ncbi:MAG: isocitrate lyase/PEP mutase family protein [Nocardioidaceae bacterium]